MKEASVSKAKTRRLCSCARGAGLLLTLLLLSGCVTSGSNDFLERIGVRDAATARQVAIRTRFEQDKERYGIMAAYGIESQYQEANKAGTVAEIKAKLKELVTKYPRSNRAGCAIQYMAQLSKGEERERYLKLAISHYSDCYYGDGVQVGAYARYYLASYYLANGKEEAANALYDEIRKKYPRAINHQGELLINIIRPPVSTDTEHEEGADKSQ